MQYYLTPKQRDVLACLPLGKRRAWRSQIATDVFGSDSEQSEILVQQCVRQMRIKGLRIHVGGVYPDSDNRRKPRIKYYLHADDYAVAAGLLVNWGRGGRSYA